MTFNEPAVLDYLRTHGMVYTVRHYPAKAPLARGTRRGHTFLGFKVQIETIVKLTMLNRDGEQDTNLVAEAPLGHYWRQSGFQSLEDWKQAIARQHSGKHRELYLLKATIVKEK